MLPPGVVTTRSIVAPESKKRRNELHVCDNPPKVQVSFMNQVLFIRSFSAQSTCHHSLRDESNLGGVPRPAASSGHPDCLGFPISCISFGFKRQ